MSAWKEVFSAEYFVDYARASREILDYIRVLWKEGFDSIVIPSRGAMPIYDCAKTVWLMESRKLQTHRDRIDSRFEYISSPLGRELILPFSADPVQEDKTQSSKDIRTFWTKVLGALVRREANSPYLIYYKFIVEQIVKDSWTSKIPFHLPREKFIFIDTVVSGRAVCEIFDAFEDEGLDQCHFILLLDREGGALKEKYRAKIREMEAARRCTLIPVRRLFTEDRGPAVSGIWSTVYPEFMSRVREKYKWAEDAYGAGSYYLRVSNNLKGFNNAGYNLPVTVINASISAIISESLRQQWATEEMVAQNISGERLKELQSENNAFLDYMVSDLIDDVSDYEPFDRATTKMLAEPRVLEKFPDAEVSVSSSHLVRVNFPLEVLARNLEKLDSYLGNVSNVFNAEGYFRNL